PIGAVHEERCIAGPAPPISGGRTTPFEPALRRDQTTSASQRVTKRRFLRRRLRTSIDHAGTDTGVLRPERYESPAHHSKATDRGSTVQDRTRGIPWMTLHHGDDVLTRRHVVVDDIHVVTGGIDSVEINGQGGRIPRHGVPSAHRPTSL